MSDETEKKVVRHELGKPEYKTILFDQDEESPFVWYLTLNRPEKNNAISIGPTEMTGEIKNAMARANHDDNVKVVVIRGAGKNYCAGFDLSFVYRVYGGEKGAKPSQRMRLQVDQDELYGFPQAILDCNKVVIVQVHGWAIEAGLYIAKCADIVVAAENAKFSQRGQRLAFGGLPTLPLELVMGHTKKVNELILTGRTFSGKEAEEAGYVTKAVPEEDLEAEVHNLATAISILPRDAIVMGKVARRHMFDRLGLSCLKEVITYHTLSTSIAYTQDEKDLMFIKDRESMGERAAFHKLHEKYEAALDKTKYFRSYDSRKK
ncbi:MAG: enoyl-CoA hydratase/isomerase family protein [Deltaproteobacteria bacterium]|nr:enoyl-CoA hydratase/isomerase family protein [Deltaproteobacteria bacterium]